jgi:hypothetical protein
MRAVYITGVNILKNSDTLHVVMSDMHSGSNYALFLDREWKGDKENTHKPTNWQSKIRKHFDDFSAEVKKVRQNKKVILVHNGDALDGDHHHSGDVCTLNELDQADIHIEIMQDFQKKIGWQRGDEIYYTRGTQTHVHSMENYIGKEVNAVSDGDFFVHDFLELNTNGTINWFAHHGPSRGNGANEGNAMRNWLRNIQQESIKDGKPVPDNVWTSHIHYPTYSSYVWRERMKFKTIHGMITPSWQMKTAFGWQVASEKTNKIGGVYQVITADGLIGVPQFCVMDSK